MTPATILALPSGMTRLFLRRLLCGIKKLRRFLLLLKQVLVELWRPTHPQIHSGLPNNEPTFALHDQTLVTPLRSFQRKMPRLQTEEAT
ncbi:hypothetical protein DSO57_1032812 [Entomophthora muscae]|uniref:Uncharacterized protein n=1 Tax=Entomophthora muscae TaxID=34485 RepID=A0ACC2TZS1_9FUNG|nr:hypothetical protein DSO57_1032812 [Entomophthora muscae]